MNAIWRIHLLGKIGVTGQAGQIRQFQSSKVAALLAQLSYKRDTQHSRDQLLDDIWPDIEIGRARQRLRQALCSLRKNLEPPGLPYNSILYTNHSHVGLNFEAVAVDVHSFEEQAQSALLMSEGDSLIDCITTATGMYEGDLLPGVYLNWVLVERQRLAMIASHLLVKLASIYQRAGDHRTALEHALKAVAIVPEQEASHRIVIDCFAALGQITDVVRQYQSLSETLRAELGRGPSPEMQAHVARLCKDSGGIKSIPRPRRTRGTTLKRPIRDDNPKAEPVHPPGVPIALTPFFGREVEIDQILRRLQPGAETPLSPRVITITGPGGIGKTRLALEIARTVEIGRVSYIPLADQRDADGVSIQLLKVLNVRDTSTESLIDKVGHVIGFEPHLVVFDNCEQVRNEINELITALLQRLPHCSFLITSRQSVGLVGEHEYPLRPLDVPLRPGTPERLLEFSAVRLFVDRARSVAPEFQLTTRNAEAVAALCSLLEGIPLAIELAASRTNVLTPLQMVEQMHRRFDLLVSRRQRFETRHLSLKAALEWSFELLPSSLQRGFASLSVFRNGWSIEAARAVCEDENIVTLLQELVERSLVYCDDEAGVMRFRMLETTREFVDVLVTPMLRKGVEERHATYFRALVVSEDDNRDSATLQSWVAEVDLENDNIAAILDRFDGSELKAELCASLARYWYRKGLYDQGVTRLLECLHNPDSISPRTQMRLLHGVGMLRQHQGDLAVARTHLLQAEELCRALSNPSQHIEILASLGILSQQLSDYSQAEFYHTESLKLARQSNHLGRQAIALSNLAMVKKAIGEYGQAMELYEASRAAFETVGDRAHIAAVLANIGAVAADTNDIAGAQAAYERALEIITEIGNPPWTAILLMNLGELHGLLANWKRGLEYIAQSLSINLDIGDREGIARGLFYASELILRLGQPEVALRLLSYSETIQGLKPSSVRADLGTRRSQLIDTITNRLNSYEFRMAWRYGELLDDIAAVAVVVSLQSTLIVTEPTGVRDHSHSTPT